MKVSLLLIVIALSAYSQACAAETCSQNRNELNGLVGLDSRAKTVYASVLSSSNECACSSVRFLEANTDTKMALSVLLAAKMANKKVRVDLLDKNDCNSAYRVYVH